MMLVGELFVLSHSLVLFLLSFSMSFFTVFSDNYRQRPSPSPQQIKKNARRNIGLRSDPIFSLFFLFTIFFEVISGITTV